MNARIEAAARAISNEQAKVHGWGERLVATAIASLTAADAVMFSDESVERAAERVTDYLDEHGYAEYSEQGYVLIDGTYDMGGVVRAVIAALRDASHATGGANGAGVAPVDAGDVTGAEGGAQP